MSRYRGSPPSTLYVRNISDRVRYDDLRRLFQKYGRLIDVTIPLDYYSGLPKGYCFVEFEDYRDAEEAQYRMDRQRLFGREIEVEFARGDRKSSGEMRTRERDRRGGDRRSYDRDRGGSYRRSRSRDSRSRRHRDRSQDSRKSRSPSPRKSRSVSRNRSTSRPAKSRSRERSRSSRDKSLTKKDISPNRGESRSVKGMSRTPSPV